MNLSWLELIILAFCSYRVTRFIVFDSLIGHTRQKLFVWLANKKGRIAHKLLEGLSCTFCVGVWITLGAVWLYTTVDPIKWGRHGWVMVAAIAGLQSLLHTWELSDEEV